MLKPILIAVSTFLWAAAAIAQTPPTIIKFSHDAASDSLKGAAVRQFQQRLNDKSAGAIRVEIYPHSQLYAERQLLEAVQLGAVEMAAPALASFSALGLRAFEIFDLPFLFPDPAALRAVTDGPVGAQILGQLERKGLVGLAYWDQGFKIFSANKPLSGPTALAGLKMRTPASKVLETQMRALGALPQTLSLTELYHALQTGMVDGTENTPIAFSEQKLSEVQKYVALTYHGYVGCAVIINKKFWEQLSPLQRAQVAEALSETTSDANAKTAAAQRDAVTTLRAGGVIVHTPTPSEMDAWRKALAPVRQEMRDVLGSELLEAVTRAVGAL